MFTAWVQKGERMFLGNQFNWKKYSRCHLMPQATNYVLSYMDLPVAEPAAETWCHGKNTKLRVRTFEHLLLPLATFAIVGKSFNFSEPGSPLNLCSSGHSQISIPRALVFK